MPEPAGGQSTVLPKVLRVRDAARAVLDRLESGDILSSVLPQAKAVIDQRGSGPHSYWLEFETYGSEGPPFTKFPLTDEDQRAGFALFLELHQTIDPAKLTARRANPRDPRPSVDGSGRDKVMAYSISELEDVLASGEKWERELTRADWDNMNPDVLVGMPAVNRDRRRILAGVRAYLYDYVARIHTWAVAEQENQALLGPDYHIVVESLDALGSKEGEKLVGALELLRSPNPEHWSAAALMCRNVVLALGRSMWKVKGEAYECQLAGKPIQIKGDKEKNCLLAFIDVHHQRTDDGGAKRELEELYELTSTIYERGSKGKGSRGVRHQEAQTLVVDTFRLVSSLQRLTDLQPVTDLASS